MFAELVRSIVGNLMDSARTAIAADDGNGLRIYLEVLGQSFADHRGYADKLMAHGDDRVNAELLGLMAELLGQGHRHGTIDLDVTFADLMATVAGLRGVVHSAPDPEVGSTGGWRRYLAFHLNGLRPA